MKKNKSALIYQHEKLLERIEMQNKLIRDFEKEIYDNINQVLCLARIKLVNLDPADTKASAISLEQSRNLIGKAIHDLRNLAKQVNKI